MPLPATIAALQQHIFNDVVWPGFQRTAQPPGPSTRYAPIDVGQRLRWLAARLRCCQLPTRYLPQ